jgi:hypothetical protein
MTELANEAREDKFTAARKRVARYAGATDRTVDEYAAQFERLGILKIHRHRRGEQNLPNEWELLPVEDEGGGEAASLGGEANNRRGGEANRTPIQEGTQETQESREQPAMIEDVLLSGPWAPVLRPLQRVAAVKGASLNPAGAITACEKHPDRAHSIEAERFAEWHLEGMGQNRPIRQVVAGWTRWLDRAPPASAYERRARTARNGQPGVSGARLREIAEELEAAGQ